MSPGEAVEAPESAEDAHEAHVPAGAHEDEPVAHVLFGAGPAVTTELGHGTVAGVGLSASWIAGPGFELEAAALVETGREGNLVPMLLLAKHPFHVSHTVEPFIGAGPELIVVPGHDGAHAVTELGGEAVAGTYLFFSRHVGASVEASFGGVRGVEEGHGVALLETGGSGRVMLRY